MEKMQLAAMMCGLA